MGKVTVSGEYKLSASGAVNGSQVPTVILADAVDAMAVATKAPVYLAGEFNEDRLFFGVGHDADSVRDPLRDVNIYLKKPVSV